MRIVDPSAGIIWLIWLYRAARVLLPFAPACRFHPSCSRYAEEALRKGGALLGIGLAIRRVLRCHPLSAGGYDPVKLS